MSNEDAVYSNLQELTQKESGAILYPDGEMLINCNWTGISGVPRTFAGGLIGFGEDITASACDVPDDAVDLIAGYYKEQKLPVPEGVFFAWKLEDGSIVITNEDWA